MRHGHLHRCRQVYDHLAVRRGLPDIYYRIADFKCELGLGSCEALRGILVLEFRSGIFLCDLLDELSTVCRDLLYLVLFHPEDLLPLGKGCGVVQVHDCLLRAYQGIKSLPYYMFPGLSKYLYGNIFRNEVVIYQFSEEFKLGFRCRRESHFDLLETDIT